jgi:hypothetical protein
MQANGGLLLPLLVDNGRSNGFMTPRRDSIPTLPPMQQPLRRGPRRRSYLPFALGVIGVAVLALFAGVFAVKSRGRRLADEAYTRAEQLFESGAFSQAQDAYERFGGEHSGDARAASARIGAELSSIAQSLDDSDTPPHCSRFRDQGALASYPGNGSP